ncbi:MAG: hypothetical protein GF398_05300 [Chitinivibrionales bacterium]|nr:hypothetical protein [Chitinivibrionales bacterium]
MPDAIFFDVLIMGGGLAGATLARWVRHFAPEGKLPIDGLDLQKDIAQLTMHVFEDECSTLDASNAELTELEKSLISSTIQHLHFYEKRGDLP